VAQFHFTLQNNQSAVQIQVYKYIENEFYSFPERKKYINLSVRKIKNGERKL